ncbi:MAG: phosphoribosylanthranilate isomerase, partial [Syntrophomonas sp.]
DDLKKIIELTGLDMVQLHGEEPPAYLEELPVPAIKSFNVNGPVNLDEIRRWRPWAYLFDSHSPNGRGGTGKNFDWKWLNEIKGRERIILAGGLNEENVGRAIKNMRPAIVDVSSAVEFPGGGKDPAKIKSFLKSVKEADLTTTTQLLP